MQRINVEALVCNLATELARTVDIAEDVENSFARDVSSFVAVTGRAPSTHLQDLDLLIQSLRALYSVLSVMSEQKLCTAEFDVDVLLEGVPLAEMRKRLLDLHAEHGLRFRDRSSSVTIF